MKPERLATAWLPLNAGMNFQFAVALFIPAPNLRASAAAWAERTFPAASTTKMSCKSDVARSCSSGPKGAARRSKIGSGVFLFTTAEAAVLDGLWCFNNVARRARTFPEKPLFYFPDRAWRNSEGPQQDRANKNKRGAHRQHIELHRDVHASHLHHSCSKRKSTRKPRLSEARRLLQRRRILCTTHFRPWPCQRHEISKQFRINKKVPRENDKIFAQAHDLT